MIKNQLSKNKIMIIPLLKNNIKKIEFAIKYYYITLGKYLRIYIITIVYFIE